jgi:hypothetical protein
MKFRIRTFLTSAILFGVLAIPAYLAAQNASSDIVIFDAPGADMTAGSGNGTFPDCANDAGIITGHFTDANRVNHGFLRSPEGEFTTFDVPGAGTIAGSGSGTFPVSINDAGAIAGRYTDAHNVNHGFLRSPGGKFTTFDVPGAGTIPGSGSGTFPVSINDAGAIAGRYTDAHNVNHGFLRSPGGKFTTFDAPGAGSSLGSSSGTFANSIKNKGAITGSYADVNNASHGFLRTP